MCIANYYLHYLGIAHRDVKLSNFVIRHNSETKEVKVLMIDFNSAAFFDLKTKFLTFEGTVHFAPPEGLDSIEEGYSPIQYDIWSLAICLYCMYHCKLPFDLDDEDDMYGYEIKMHMKILKDKWKKLHRLIYLISLFGAIHYLWLVKRDLTEPLIFLAVILVLLAFRLKLKSN